MSESHGSSSKSSGSNGHDGTTDLARASPTYSELPRKILDLLRSHSFQVVSYIARGSTCSVYQVKDIRVGAILSAKVVEEQRITPMVRALVSEEMRIMGVLSHPYIVRTERVISVPGWWILVTEYAPNGDLIGLIEKRDAPAPGDLVQYKRWFVQITQALAYVHSCGIAHRDIKADNVLLFPQGIAKLADFGYATYCRDAASGKIIASTISCGTMEYKAPEALIMSSPFDPQAADCFSLGVLLYVMMTHQFPFGSGDEMRQQQHGNKSHNSMYGIIMRKGWQPEGVIATDSQLKSLLAQLMNPVIRERITAAQALAHPWIADDPNCTRTD